ncbi:hypothetical protein [Fimbriiglobus ruber]|uniref:Uncharacterized protein n=1 Tax=Fimbriiglobus ruber TaxID=1908690 RepID=A0A225DE22_9BACT|nr:hypothetical protein [Fimbriiglobus ruber]OWK37884.1 hypothetical protein FRUB_07004 [Fimbriiglobus ruber]
MDYADRAPDVWSTVGILRYSSYPDDLEALAIKVSAERDSEQLGLWTLTYDYSSRPFDFGNSGNGSTLSPTQTDQSVDPPSRPPTFEWGSVATTRLLGPKDQAGKAVVNSAGQVFDPPIEIPSHNATCTITSYKDISGFDPIAKINTFQDSINSAAFVMVICPGASTTFPAKTVRCTKYACSTHCENNAYFWEVKIELEIKLAFWNPVSVLDAGTLQIASAGLPPQPILDKNGAQVTSPVPLNGMGLPLNAGGTLQYIDFKGYQEVDFAGLLS